MSNLMELVEDYADMCVRANDSDNYGKFERAKESANKADAILSEIRAAVAELERDAARYRYLSTLIKYRDEPDAITRAYMNWEVEVSSMAPATLGEAIDAAMEADNVPER